MCLLLGIYFKTCMYVELQIHRVIHYTKAFNSKILETTKMVINVVIKYHALMYIRTMGYHAHAGHNRINAHI